MFRSVDGCASSSGRRRDANIKKKEERTKRLYEKQANGVEDTCRLQHHREAAEEGACKSDDAKGLSELQGRCSSCARVRCRGAGRALLR